MVGVGIESPIDKKHQVEHLFLLIGSNPLPNYVAARLLWRRKAEGAKLYFVCSKGTQTVAERLANKLTLELNEKQFVSVSESDPLDIYQKVYQAACKIQGSIGLNYTGGTKTMAVHTYRAIADFRRQCIFSYLDARTLEMVIEGNGTSSLRIPVGLALQMSMQDILELHGYQYHQVKGKMIEPDAKPTQPEFLNLWARVEFDDRDTWVNDNLMYFNQKEERYLIRPYDELRSISLPCAGKFAVLDDYWQHKNLKTFEDLARSWNMEGNKDKQSKLGNWLYSFWLEDYVLMCVQAVAQQCGIHEAGKSVEPHDLLADKYEGNEACFEFDVYAIKGFQLFGISCTIERKRLLKLKLFEAFVRARQIGGDEARVGLVCMAGENPDNGRPKLKRQLKEGWDESANMIEVFGAKDLLVAPNGVHKLQQQLIEWFSGRVVHE